MLLLLLSGLTTFVHENPKAKEDADHDDHYIHKGQWQWQGHGGWTGLGWVQGNQPQGIIIIVVVAAVVASSLSDLPLSRHCKKYPIYIYLNYL